MDDGSHRKFRVNVSQIGKLLITALACSQEDTAAGPDRLAAGILKALVAQPSLDVNTVDGAAGRGAVLPIPGPRPLTARD